MKRDSTLIVLGWNWVQGWSMSHYWQKRDYSTLVLAACGLVEDSRRLRAEDGHERCYACGILLHLRPGSSDR